MTRRGINCATNTEGERCGGHGLGMECGRTCLLCPSLLSHKDVALGVSLQLRPSLAHRTHLQPQFHASILRRVGRIDVDVPLSRLFSPKKPTSCSGLLRTVLTMTASFSRPWNPSTDPSSMPGYASLSIPESKATYATKSTEFPLRPVQVRRQMLCIA